MKIKQIIGIIIMVISTIMFFLHGYYPEQIEFYMSAIGVGILFTYGLDLLIRK